jgi:hypothetical protein
LAPPAEKGTTSRIGLVGHVCAWTLRDSVQARAAAVAHVTAERRRKFTVGSWFIWENKTTGGLIQGAQALCHGPDLQVVGYKSLIQKEFMTFLGSLPMRDVSNSFHF